jgi:hypothetical protein
MVLGRRGQAELCSTTTFGAAAPAHKSIDELHCQPCRQMISRCV